MFRVSYIINNSISHKGGFKTEEEAREWILNTTNIKPLKLLTDRGNATATTFFKRVYA